MSVIQCSRATAKISIAKISSSTVCRAEYSHEYYFHETWSVFRATSVSDNLVNNINPYKTNVTSTLTIIIQPHRQLSHTHDKMTIIVLPRRQLSQHLMTSNTHTITLFLCSLYTQQTLFSFCAPLQQGDGSSLKAHSHCTPKSKRIETRSNPVHSNAH